MASVPPLVEAVGVLTVVTSLQQIITGALEEQRKSSEAKRVRRRDRTANRAEAEALADREAGRSVRRIRELLDENDTLRTTITARDGEILHLRGEITALYRELYNSDPKYHPPNST